MSKDDRKIRIIKTPEVTDLAGEKVMIDFDTGKYFMLTGAANDIWDMINDGASISGIVEGLCALYEVSEDQCLASTVEFLQKLVQYGFIEFYV